MTDSILNSTKKLLGIEEDYDAFDIDILMHINSTFSTINQLGVGPEEAFAITGASETWSDFLVGTTGINSIKTYMALSVRLLFDPPATSFAIAAMEKQVSEFGWRLSVSCERYALTQHEGSIP